MFLKMNIIRWFKSIENKSRFIPWVFVAIVALSFYIGAVIVADTNKEQENISLSPSLAYVYSVSSLMELSIGGAEESGNLQETDAKLLNWKVMCPVASSSYTQSYWSKHLGVDLIPLGKDINIYAGDEGKVIFAGPMGGYGNRVEIKHPNGAITTYSHLAFFSVKTGDSVKQGQTLGKMGLTGATTGLHLHFEILYDSVKINPESYIE